MSTIITAAWLLERDACQDQIDLFKRVWPDGAMITRAALLHAAEEGLHVSWLAPHVLPDRLWAQYKRQRAPLLAEFERQDALLQAEYQRQEAPLGAQYLRQHAPPLLAEYERQVAPLRAEYERQLAPLLAEFERQVASLLADLLELSS